MFVLVFKLWPPGTVFSLISFDDSQNDVFHQNSESHLSCSQHRTEPFSLALNPPLFNDLNYLFGLTFLVKTGF